MSSERIYCSRCGQANAVDSRFCSNCGATLQASQPPQPSQPPQQQPQQSYSPPPPQQTYAPPPPPQQQSGGKKWLFTCLILGAIFLCLTIGVVAVGWFYGDTIWGTVQGWLQPGSQNGATVTGTGSAPVGSGQAGVISGGGGAKITVPAGAVPPTDAGEAGTMVFSIEQDSTQTVSLSQDTEAVGPVYRLGPEGFTFALPVEVTLPIPAGTNAEDVTGVAFYDVASSAWVLMPATVNAGEGTVTFQTTHFSLWTVWRSRDNWRERNGGWIEVENSHRRGSGSYPGGRGQPMSTWYGVCIDSYTPDDPSIVSRWMQPRDWKIGARDESTNRFWVPAGQYRLTEFYGRSEINNMVGYIPEHDSYYRPIGVFTVEPGETVKFQPESFSQTPADAIAGSPTCWGEVTTSVGTGDVQITLTWQEEADLDLYVTDPNGDTVYYANTTIPSGGELDRDNKCSNFVMGQPENVFWPESGAPSGTYTVSVNYFGDCEDAGSVEYTVRTVVMGETETFTGRLDSAGETDEVTTFTVP